MTSLSRPARKTRTAILTLGRSLDCHEATLGSSNEIRAWRTHRTATPTILTAQAAVAGHSGSSAAYQASPASIQIAQLRTLNMDKTAN